MRIAADGSRKMTTGNREVFVLNIRSLGFNADNQFPPLSIELITQIKKVL